MNSMRQRFLLAGCLLLLASCHRVAQVEEGTRLGRGRSVHVEVRESFVSQGCDAPEQVLACLIWAKRTREDLDAREEALRTGFVREGDKTISPGIKKVGDKWVRSNVEDLVPTIAVVEPPILIVVRRNSRAGFSRGVRTSFPQLSEDSCVLQMKTELLHGEHVWASYEAAAEPFSESLVIDGKERRLDAGRVFLADFASQLVGVRRVDGGTRVLEEACESLASDPVPDQQQRECLQSTLRRLAARDETIRQFVGGALRVTRRD